MFHITCKILPIIFSDDRKESNLSTTVSVSELNSYLVEIRGKFLEQVSAVLPRYEGAKEMAEIDLHSSIPAGIIDLDKRG